MSAILSDKKLTSTSFKGCYIDIYPISNGQDIVKVCEDKLGGWPEFKDKTDKYPSKKYRNTQIIRYICAFYDPKSPFANLEWPDRKLASATFVGFDLKDGAFVEEAQVIMNCEIDVVRAMVIRYCRIVRGPEYSAYKTLELHYNTKMLQNPDLKLVDLEKSLQTLQKYRDQILAQDTSAGLREHFYKVVSDEEKELLALRPERQQQYWAKEVSSITLNSAADDEEEDW